MQTFWFNRLAEGKGQKTAVVCKRTAKTPDPLLSARCFSFSSRHSILFRDFRSVAGRRRAGGQQTSTYVDPSAFNCALSGVPVRKTITVTAWTRPALLKAMLESAVSN